jgi:hypothetical protein
LYNKSHRQIETSFLKVLLICLFFSLIYFHIKIYPLGDGTQSVAVYSTPIQEIVKVFEIPWTWLCPLPPLFTISRTKNTQARQTSGLFFVFFTSLRLILRASDHLLISKTVVWAKRWTIIVSKSGGRGQSQVQGISKTFTISWMGVE